MDFSFSILSPICDSIKKYRDRNAFFINGKYYSYNCFSERISAIRVAIKTLHSDEQVCAIAVHDDLDTYATIIALWMEGKAYVPLHPNQPLERNLNIIRQVDLHYVFDSEKNSAFGTVCGVDVVNTSSLNFETEFIDDWGETSDDKLAYILFTSGSTGKPKGVPLSRKNLASFIEAFWKEGYKVNPEDRCLQCFDLTFDLSVFSFLVPILKSACVYTLSYVGIKYMQIVRLLSQQHITCLLMTPSTIQHLQPYFGELEFPDIRYSLFCGEALPTKTAMDWMICVPNAEVFNVYGPTEDTIFCTTYKLNRENNNVDYNGVLSIGKSMQSGKIIIVDDNNQEVAEDSIGELCLSGEQLTLGYWNNPEKDKEVFWYAADGTRYYRSGDLCCYGKDGNVLFVGRKDSQAKIQGFRVELGEIEFHAREFFENEKRVVAIAFQNSDNLTEIALFIESEAMETKPLVEYLRGKMPFYMIPTRFLFESVFPLNKSEKIDRVILKQKLSEKPNAD